MGKAKRNKIGYSILQFVTTEIFSGFQYSRRRNIVDESAIKTG